MTVLAILYIALCTLAVAACFSAIVQTAIVDEVFKTRREQVVILAGFILVLGFTVLDIYNAAEMSLLVRDIGFIDLLRVLGKIVVIYAFSRVLTHVEYLIDSGKLSNDHRTA